ncbi:hypothetical protein F5880DRAFT_1698226 [Lentinula raphanica]|nr:hypothetical protein F5880DRAFT_1698226 [Lentinula raphanica]
MDRFDATFDSVKAETLRSLVRDLGHKGPTKRDDMINFMKVKLFGDEETETTTRTTRSTTTAIASNDKNGATSHKTISAPGLSRSTRKRKAEDLDKASYDDSDAEEIENGDNAAKHTRKTRSAQNNNIQDSVSAGPRRGRPRTAVSQPSSDRSPQRASGTAAGDTVPLKRGRGRPRRSAPVPPPKKDDELSDADADGDYEEEDTPEEVPSADISAQPRKRGRPRKVRIPDGEEKEEVSVPVKRGRGRPRKDHAASASAPVPRTSSSSSPSKKPRSSTSVHMSTRSSTGHSPSKKPKSRIAVPPVKRTYGSVTKGGIRLRGRPPKAAAMKTRKPRSSLSKQTIGRPKPEPRSRTMYNSARTRANEGSDSSASGRKFTFDGVELVSQNRAKGANAEAGGANAEGGAGVVDMNGVGENNARGNERNEGEAQVTSQDTVQPRSPAPHSSNTNSSSLTPSGNSINEEGAPKDFDPDPQSDEVPGQSSTSDNQQEVSHLLPATNVSPMPKLPLKSFKDDTSPAPQQEDSGTITSDSKKVIGLNTTKIGDDIDMAAATTSSAKLAATTAATTSASDVDVDPLTTVDTFSTLASSFVVVPDASNDRDSRSNSLFSENQENHDPNELPNVGGVENDELLHDMEGIEEMIGAVENELSHDMEGIEDDEDEDEDENETSIMDPPLVYPIEVEVHTEQLTMTEEDNLGPLTPQEVEQGLDDFSP